MRTLTRSFAVVFNVLLLSGVAWCLKGIQGVPDRVEAVVLLVATLAPTLSTVALFRPPRS